MSERTVSLAAVLAFGVVLISALMLLSSAVQANPGDVLVDRATGVDQPSCGDGMLPPCFSIQYAVSSVAAAGDTVLVAPGTYTETIFMKPGVAVVSQSGPALTFIDGENVRGPMVSATNADVTSTARLEGFFITRGHAGWHGGGVFVAGGASPVISNTWIISNSAGAGGGIALEDGTSLLLYGSRLERNSGTGLHMNNASATIISSTLRFNHSPGRGGAMSVLDSNVVLSDSLVFSNTAASNAGGLYIVNSTGRAVGNTIQHNVSGGGGGGIFVWQDSTFEIFDNLIEHNVGNGQGGIGVSVGADVQIISNTIQHNESLVHWGGGIGVDGAMVVISGNLILSNTVRNHGGGGIQVIGGTDLVEIRNNVIEHNIANGGGGMALASGSAVVAGNTVRHNTARVFFGGGMTVGSGDAYLVERNVIAHNTGGGIRAEPAASTFVNNLVYGNTEDQMIMYGSQHITVTNNTFVGLATDDGITIGDGGYPLIANNIIAGNARGIYASGTVTPTLVHNNLWDNAVAHYQGVTPGADDVLCDPDFVAPASKDYHLGICSCAVDAGINTGAPGDDYDGDTRPVDGDGDGTATVDIGADERLIVTAPLPVVGFTHVTAGLRGTFTNTSSHAVTYGWDFGDDVGTSNAVNPTYTYAAPGAYLVTLTGASAFGCADVYQDVVEVTCQLLYLPIVLRGYP
jgi:parallel beta-helix repeat protein